MLKYNRQVEGHSVGAFQVQMHSVSAFQVEMHNVGACYGIVFKYTNLLYRLYYIKLY